MHVSIIPAYVKGKQQRLPDQARSERRDMWVCSVMIPCILKDDK
ncbi:hypothetical protein PV783_26480 [Chitinophaga sp. CC14]